LLTGTRNAPPAGKSRQKRKNKMETKTLENGNIEVKMTWERLAAMVDNGQELYKVPSGGPYWAARPSFHGDVRVGTAEDFQSAEAKTEFCREEDDPDYQDEEYILVYDPEFS
jgi:hypothetical protein